jgi:hypothetical protein
VHQLRAPCDQMEKEGNEINQDPRNKSSMSEQ